VAFGAFFVLGCARYGSEIPPNLLVVLDRSGSMRDPMVPSGRRSKLQDAQDALTWLLSDREGDIRFGFLYFPTDDRCEPGTVGVPISDNSVSEILQILGDLTGLGGTPTGESLQAAGADPALYDELRGEYVVLLTDGLPTCPVGNGRQVTDEDCQLALQAVSELHFVSIDTLVVGLGEDLNSSEPDLLNEMAQAGGRPRTGEASQYYQANSLNELESLLGDIADIVTACSLNLDSVPEIPEWVLVYLDGVPIWRDPDRTDGWEYGQGADKIFFYGPACDEIRQTPEELTEVISGCMPP
jgi:hypothetical protein